MNLLAQTSISRIASKLRVKYSKVKEIPTLIVSIINILEKRALNSPLHAEILLIQALKIPKQKKL